MRHSKSLWSLSSLVLLGVLAAAPVQAGQQTATESSTEAPPRAIRGLLQCRSLTEAAARLACFDREAAAFDVAVRERNVVVADREAVKEARRGLFGLTLPSLSLFGRDDDEKVRVDAIEAKITEARKGPDRNWRFSLEDGSRWTQTDARMIVREPKPGMAIAIRKAAGGSYFGNVDGQVAVRVRRVN
ncbi:hypothetical protein FHS79_002841 [Polymorphobacter multimanifer]|uniref:Secreted protein n=1 Tax=Polymorphobacter multimanifer TaxID=1070431 RepID=A0A841LAH3_9SPHN|nr:hypothetical protein [Polymorphobacter multimanifer]MBB6228651.1 hypothetical protein [Polymorphobacter multimanifer]